MTNTNILINFVLDQSGSMVGVRDDTIEGVNTFMTDQAAQPGTALLTLTKFDTAYQHTYTALDLDRWEPWGHDDYVPGGMTALFDAVGTCIKRTEQWLADHPFDGQVVCVILTDGHENSSRDWHINLPPIEGDDHDVAQLIRHKQDHDGWQFVFLGSGGTDWLERTFGHVVARDRFTGYSGQHTNSTYSTMSSSLTKSRKAAASGRSVDFLVDEQAIKDDAEARSKE